MIFLTVGTQFPFDRLVKAVDKACEDGLLDEDIIAQTGKSSYTPHNFECVNSMNKDKFDDCLKNATGIIGHCGMGTISMAIDNNKPMLAMPRFSKYGEVVNDHQVGIAQKFEELGHILVAYNEKQLAEKIKQLKIFVPRPRISQPEKVAEKIRQFLNMLT